MNAAHTRFHVDREGALLHDGAVVQSEGVLAMFAQGLDRDRDGLYFLCGRERCGVTAEDAPFVVRSARPVRDGAGRVERIVGRLGMGLEEELDAATFHFEAGIPYVRVRGGKIRARLSRAAFLAVAELAESDGDGYVLPVGGRRIRIEGAGD